MNANPTVAPDRSVVLLTGMSGTGKSTVLVELARRGHQVLHTDDSGWIVNAQAPNETEPLWDLDKIRGLLDRHRTGWLFIDAVVLLSAPVEVILERVTDRGNPFGSTATERAKITSDLTDYEPLLRAGADHEIVTTAPIADVVTAIERVAGRA